MRANSGSTNWGKYRSTPVALLGATIWLKIHVASANNVPHPKTFASAAMSPLPHRSNVS